MKKKVVASTLAASLVLGSLSGLPLSQQGLLQKFNLSDSAYAAALPSDEVINQIKKIYAQLNESELTALNAALSKIRQLEPAENTNLITPLWSKIEAAMDNPANYPDLTERNIVWLIQQLAITYDENLSELERVRTDPQVRKILVQLAQLAGVSGIELTDLDAFQKQLDASLKASFKENLPEILAGLVSGKFEESWSVAFKGAAEGLLAENLKISEVAKKLDITAADLEAVRKLWTSEIDADYAVQKILGGAFLRNEAQFTSAIQNNGRTLVPNLKLFGIDLGQIPGSSQIISWEVVSSPNNNITAANNRFVLRSAATRGEATIRGTIKLPNLELDVYRGTIRMEFTGSGSGGGGGAPIGGVPSLPPAQGDSVIVAPVVENALERINSIIDGLQNRLAGLTDNQAVHEASEIVAEAVRAASVVNLSQTITVEDGVAKASFDIDDLAESFKNIKAIVDAANKQLLEEVPGATQAKAIAVLDFGKVDADRIELPISKELLDLAAANGIEALAFTVNGVSVTTEIKSFNRDTLLVFEPVEPASLSSELRLASDLYNLEFISQGETISTFSLPVELRFPITSTISGPARERLVLANLDEVDPVIKGGRFDRDGKNIVAFTKDFSTYGVIDNLKSFNDISSVAQWAGQAIETAAAHGIIDGRAPGEFVPQAPVTRAEFAKMIVLVFGLEELASSSASFVDVNDSDWFQPYVAAASAAGIVNGRAEGRFEPNAHVTRAEMAVMASRALEQTRGYVVSGEVEQALSRFMDAADIHPSLQSGVGLSAQEGIIEGEENNRFNPNASSTRAQAAVVIYRLLKK
ncbi:S-layer homology domain-containing protein [Paenibacillus senegalensis]|uniref:S-layer homology domain-containing protein n=1 Tax=Paenibacillus senegalensis TaxID=1465766 RepID=UPI000287DA7A|nr:S-layer homology domain-containing protein [Paenibacillus senegalensis]